MTDIDALAATVRDHERFMWSDGVPTHERLASARVFEKALQALVEHARTLERERDEAERLRMEDHAEWHIMSARADLYEKALREYGKEECCPDCNGDRTLPDGTDCEWCGTTGFISAEGAWDDGRRARAALAGEDT